MTLIRRMDACWKQRGTQLPSSFRPQWLRCKTHPVLIIRRQHLPAAYTGGQGCLSDNDCNSHSFWSDLPTQHLALPPPPFPSINSPSEIIQMLTALLRFPQMLKIEALWNSATGLLLVPAFSKYCKKEKKRENKNKSKPTLLHSSFIADNLLGCQESKKCRH